MDMTFSLQNEGKKVEEARLLGVTQGGNTASSYEKLCAIRACFRPVKDEIMVDGFDGGDAVVRVPI